MFVFLFVCCFVCLGGCFDCFVVACLYQKGFLKPVREIIQGNANHRMTFYGQARYRNSTRKAKPGARILFK